MASCLAIGLKTFDAKSNELAKPDEVVCMADSFGDAAKGQTGMENCLQKNPNINVVYAINEPAAAGAYKAIKAAGEEKDVVILAVDGMCSNGVGDVEKGVIAATSMQYPLKMAALGVAAGVQYAKERQAPVGLHRHRCGPGGGQAHGRCEEHRHQDRPWPVLG